MLGFGELRFRDLGIRVLGLGDGCKRYGPFERVKSPSW